MEDRKNAHTKQTAAKTEVKWNDSGIRTVYADVCTAAYTREEIELLFGTGKKRITDRNEINAELKARITLTPLSAKRLAAKLDNVIKAYDSGYRPQDLNSAFPGKGERIRPSGRKLSFYFPDKADKKAVFLIQLIEKHKIKCGIEGSFKMLENKLLGNRYIFGIDKEELEPEKIFDICRSMDMPDNFMETFIENLHDANMFALAFEENKTSCVYKVYLEFWDKVVTELRNKTDKSEPVLLHMGFKWDARDNTRGATARYTCYPMLSVNRILKRISDIYEGYKDQTSFKIIKDIIDLASSRTVNDPFIYLEANEENNPRRSFDINLYKANLLLKDIGPLLTRMSEHYSVPPEKFNILYEKLSNKIFGHLSGGIGRDGKDFLTTYYEV